MIWLIVIPLMLIMAGIILGLAAFLFVGLPMMAYEAWKERNWRDQVP